MKRRYRNPPIQEAVCEIHFLSAPLEENTIREIGPVWMGEYPLQNVVADTSFEIQMKMAEANVKQNLLGNRLIATSEDGHRIAQLSSSRFLAVNQLKPYQGWAESFRGEILSRFEEVQRCIAINEITAVNLRYIDRLDIPQRPIEWQRWLRIGMPIASNIPVRGGALQSQFQQMLSDKIKLSSAIATAPNDAPDVTSIILDNTVSYHGRTEPQMCGEILERVHEPHPTIFHELLTPETQELLGGYESV